MPCTPQRVWRAIQGAGGRGTVPTEPAPAGPTGGPPGDPGALSTGAPATSEGEPGMIPSAFDYVAPESVADALTALADGGEDAKILAGGQSLHPGAAAPDGRSRLVDRPAEDP